MFRQPARVIKAGGTDNHSVPITAGQGQAATLVIAVVDYKGADTLYGNGVGYKYPHDYPYHVVEQTYLPDDLLDHSDAHVFQLDGSGIGHEQIIAKRLQAIDNLINTTDDAL